MLKHKLQLFADEVAEAREGATLEEGQTSTETQPLTADEVQKLIQKEADRVRTEYSKKLKEKDTLLEQFQTEKMSAEEKAKFELEKLQKTLAEKETSLKMKELTLKTMDLLKENELPLEFKDFAIGQDEESTIERVKALKDVFLGAVQKAVESKFKENGRDVHKDSVQTNNLEEQYQKALKDGNMALAIALKNKMFANQ